MWEPASGAWAAGAGLGEKLLIIDIWTPCNPSDQQHGAAALLRQTLQVCETATCPPSVGMTKAYKVSQWT